MSASGCGGGQLLVMAMLGLAVLLSMSASGDDNKLIQRSELCVDESTLSAYQI